jgi:hypothetical protein
VRLHSVVGVLTQACVSLEAVHPGNALRLVEAGRRRGCCWHAVLTVPVQERLGCVLQIYGGRCLFVCQTPPAVSKGGRTQRAHSVLARPEGGWMQVGLDEPAARWGRCCRMRRAVGLWLCLVALGLYTRIWVASICRLARGL